MLQYVGVMGCLDKEIYLFVDERVAIQGLWFFSLVIGDEAEFGFAAASIAVLHCAVAVKIAGRTPQQRESPRKSEKVVERDG
ncbi:hypothetical protein I3842_11G150100 [Carya illinoinensis]|uniref:Uncharacterized protein n=1 Tax=Carya illinoinensis TaxID=32201 RepID=A0A922DRF1_CARIL|nr:hypothetical protein I3842_11G150100 [Carya illinoinensis]